MSKWWSVCEICGLGTPEDQPSVITKDCEHVWVFVKEKEEEK